MLDTNVIDAFHAMYGPFPEPVMLLHRDRTVLAVNNAARTAGIPTGIKCSSLNPENKTDGNCRQCKAALALKTGKPVAEHSLSRLGHMKAYWIPLKDVPDVYLHFGVLLDDDFIKAMNASIPS